AGARSFETVNVSSARAWVQTGRFENTPYHEIAIIRGNIAILLDSSDLHERTRIPISPVLARRWTREAALARRAAPLVAVRTGGGYSDTEVRTLDDILLWRFRPREQLPAVSLIPADLDADGELEFYASNGDFVARLNAAGHEVWRRPTRYPAGLLLS